MTTIFVIIWVLATQNLGQWWWLAGACIVIDLVHVGYKLK